MEHAKIIYMILQLELKIAPFYKFIFVIRKFKLFYSGFEIFCLYRLCYGFLDYIGLNSTDIFIEQSRSNMFVWVTLNSRW